MLYSVMTLKFWDSFHVVLVVKQVLNNHETSYIWQLTKITLDPESSVPS